MKLKNVLLIDDSEIDTLVNRKVVERMGIASNIHVRNSAISAFDFLKSLSENDYSNLPELIFLDIRMPDIDGFGFLKLFEKLSDRVKQNCKIVMLSSSIDLEDYNKAMQCPYVIHFLNKPLSKETFAEIAVKLKKL
jgi:CheY-like chemotaxis protein